MPKTTLFKYIVFPLLFILVITAILLRGFVTNQTYAAPAAVVGANQAFDQASKQFGVPISILKAICYMEGRLSDHNGSPSVDQGYTCMHLVHDGQATTLDSAAKDLGVSINLLKTDLATSIRGGAAVLHDYALHLSSTHTLPATLADWYAVVAAYSNASTQSVAHMYADGVYKLLNSGFSASTETGEVVKLAPQAVKPHVVVAAANVRAAATLPVGCVNDGKTDYPGAIDCILNPNVYDCNIASPGNSTNPCSYQGANRPNDLPISFVGIHDIEGSVQDGLDSFQNVKRGVSIQYIVDTDGTIYQVTHEKDIAFHIGNFWYNQRSIGIEHAGIDAIGYQWYNAAEYLGSAKLVSYLLKKYNIPLDHDHVISHGTVPSPSLQTTPNHVDPGPYWLWDYYFGLIHQQGVAQSASPKSMIFGSHFVTIHPRTDQAPLGAGGRETTANFNFFYLYTGPSTQSRRVPAAGGGGDITDETNSVEPGMSYPYLSKIKDPAGTGDTLYLIWYGEFDHLSDKPSSEFENAKLAWLAVPPGADTAGQGTLVLVRSAIKSNVAKIYGRPTTSDANVIGDAPNFASFASMFMATESGTNHTWYEINYNHRQAWVPATEVTIL